MLNLREYAETFGFQEGVIKPTSRYIGSASQVERRTFSGLAEHELQINTPLEFALLSYYSPPVLNIRPAEADAILPANNPKLADQKLGAAVFQEIQILRFLGNTEAVNRHEAVLQFITGRGNATRAEIEAFYRNNVRALVSQVVDEEFTGVTVPAVTVTYVKDSLTNFLTTPNQTNFNTLRGIYHSTDGNLEYIQQSYNADMANLATAESIGANNLIESYRSSARNAQNILNTRRRQLNAPNDTPIDWNGFRSAYRTILNGLNTELVRRM
jgi:hypothetical protein